MEHIEEWRDVVGWEGIYSVSNYGKVMNNKTAKLRKFRKEKLGYLSVDLWNNGYMKRLKIHRMVAQAFLPNTFDKPQVNHIDGNKENNVCYNLEWTTAKENSIHAYKTGLSKPMRGEQHGRSKLTKEQAMHIRYSPDKDYVLATLFSVSPRLVRKIKHNDIWKETFVNDSLERQAILTH